MSGFTKWHEREGRPWGWPRWKEITNVQHGLFPADDSHLAVGWNRPMALHISAYFDRYYHIPNEEARIKFAAQHAGGHEIPGRGMFSRWINVGWKEWDIQNRIIKVIRELDHHPITIMVKTNDPDWPAGETYVPLFVNGVALELFGTEAFGLSNHLSQVDRQVIQIFIQRVWTNLRRQVARSRTRIVKLEELAMAAFSGMSRICTLFHAVTKSSQALDRDKPTKKKITAVITAVARWRNLAEMLSTTENLNKMQSMDEELAVLMSALGADVSKTPTTTSKLLAVP